MIGRAACVALLRLAGGLAWCTAAALPGRAVAQRPERPAWEDAPVRVELPGVGALEVLARSADGVLRYPLADIMALVEVRVVSDGLREWRGRMEPDGPDLALDLTTATGRFGAVAFALPAVGAERDSTGWWVTAEVLTRLLGTEVRYDPSLVVLSIAPVPSLPALRRALREARRSRMVADPRTSPSDTAVGTPTIPVGGAVVEWTATARHVDPARNNSWGAGLGLALAGGSLDARVFEQRQAIAGPIRQRTVSWTRAWPDRRDVGQVLLGHVALPGTRPRLLQGAVLSNVPFVRPLTYGTRTVRGRTGPGWEVEITRSDGVIAFARADSAGAYEVTFPVEYGPNYHERVERSPLGEEHRTALADPVPFDRLPVGRFEYVASAGRCRFAVCEAAAGANARYGLTDRLTVEAGVDGVRAPGQRDAVQPFLALSGSPVARLNLGVDAVPRAFVRGRADLDPSAGRHLDVQFAAFDTTVVTAVAGRSFDRRRLDVNGFFVVPWTKGRTFVSGNGFTADAYRSERSGLSGAISVWLYGNTRALFGTRSVLLRSNDRRDLLASDQFTMEGAADFAPAAWRGAYWRAAIVRDRARGIADLSVALTHAFGRSLQFTAELGWQRGVGTRFALNAASLAGGVRTFLNTRWDDAVGSTGESGVEGTLIADPSVGRLGLWTGRAVGQGGVAGFAFIDVNANGVRDPGEAGVEGVRLAIGSRLARTDGRGQYRVWDLPPFSRVRVEVDTSSLVGALLMPRFSVIEAAPTPNTYRELDIPLVPVSDARGDVTLDGAPIANVRLLVRGVATRRQRVVRTFSDGLFEVTGLLPDRYEVFVDAGDLTRLAADAAAVGFIVRALPDGDRVEDIRVRLTSWPRGKGAPPPDDVPSVPWRIPTDSVMSRAGLRGDTTAFARAAPVGALTRTPEAPVPLSSQQVGPVYVYEGRAVFDRLTIRGEYLRRIAARELGDEMRWPEVWRVNRKEVPNPELIRADAKLRVPVRDAAETDAAPASRGGPEPARGKAKAGRQKPQQQQKQQPRRASDRRSPAT